MAEFQIKSKDGLVTRATGAPVYNGTYLKPGYLEFAEIASPTPIDWQAGDYVDYPRTGLRYRLYNTPKSRKQGEQNLYGASFVYENVQFFDITKELELAPFADFVPDDNLIHFSTLNSVAFFGTPANVAERVQACLNYWFPSSNWIVRVITGLDPSTDAELIETLSTDAEFSVSGTSCQGALDRLYDTWNGLGYSFSQSGGNNIITIGYPNKRTVANTTSSYGRIDDNGIVTLARSVSNVDEIGTRLYAYGSMRNMPTGYYREKDIKDAESVDIEHLMLPINAVPSLNYGGWGETDNLPDARKAYIENSAAISQLGLIPRYAYFDGSDSNYPEICPSIEGATIGDVIDGKQATGDTDYVPSLSKWSRDDRIDEIVSATNPSDAGGGSNSGSKYSESGDHSTAAGTIDSSEGETEWELGSYSPSAPSGSAYIVLNVDGEIEIATEDIDKIEVVAKLIAGPGVSGTSIYDIPVEMDMGSESDVHAFTLSNVSANIVSKGITYVRINFVIQREGQEPVDYLATINAGTVFIGFTPYITKTFSVSIPQIGFNLLQYADMGNGKTISMKTGMCAGRDFPITAASYVSSSDTWSLTLSRVKDSDTGLLYPNSDFPIAEGDKYVLLDIAMPELYISMASIRLLKAAQKLLGDIDHEKPFYEPEIDSKRVYNESRVLREGMWMHLVGDEIVDGGEDYSIIDTLQIDEGVSNIPVYSVTLREKKPVEWTESISQSSRTVTSSAVDESATPAQSSGSANLDWFIQESYDDSGSTKYRLKLNPKYQGMYAEGWVSAGGVSGTGGGTIVASLKDLTDVDDNLNPSSGQVLTYDGTKWTAGNGGQGSVTGITVGGVPYSPVSGIVALPAYPTTLPASDVYAWAKKSSLEAADVPSLPISKITGLQSALSGYLPLTGGTMTNTNLVTNLNADLLDGMDSSSFITLKSLRSDLDSIYGLRFNYGTFDKGDYQGEYASEYPYNYGAYLSLTYDDKNTGFIIMSEGTQRGHLSVATRAAGDWNTSFGPWQTLAYTSDNVASATKLETSRSIWGQPFDGTDNVDGILTLTYASTARDTGIEVMSSNSGEASIGFTSTNRTDFGRYSDRGFIWGSVAGEIMTLLDNGNVGVGVSAPSYKLDVAGDSRTSGKVYIGTTGGYLEVVNVGTQASPSYALRSTLPFYSDSWVSAGGVGTSGGGGGASYLNDLLDVTTTGVENGQALVYNNGVWSPHTIEAGDTNTQFVFTQSQTEPPAPTGIGGTSWTAVADVNWITLGKSSGNGSDTISYTVAANTGNAMRSGTITVTYQGGSKTLTVTQSGVYELVDYIMATGSQYINTGLYGDEGTTVTIDFTPTVLVSGAGRTVFGHYNSSSDSISVYLAPGGAYTRYDGVSVSWSWSTLTRYEVTLSPTGAQRTANGSTESVTWSASSFTTAGEMKLGYGGTGNYFYGRLYGCKIWDGSTLVMELVPAYDTVGGVYGMYDNVSNTFLTSATGTDFDGPS